MARFPFYASLERTNLDDDKRHQLLRTRNNILQSSTSNRLVGWTKNNFLSSLKSRPRYRLNVVVVDITEGQSSDQAFVSFADGGRITLKDLLAVLEDNTAEGGTWNILVLYGHEEGLRTYVPALQLARTLVILSIQDDHVALFGLACELSIMWELQSAVASKVTFGHLAHCALNLISGLAACLTDRELAFTHSALPNSADGIAWEGGHRYAEHADIEKFRVDARDEQKADALRRIADAAAYLRLEHAPTAERMISTQGLFWLSELAAVNDLRRWFADTRLFRELVPEYEHHRPDAPFLITTDAAQVVAEEVMGQMVEVPPGRYSIGSIDPELESEPPANPITVDLPAFRIMRDPFSAGSWQRLTGVALSGMASIPVTGISFFDCLDAAEAMTIALHKRGLRIRLCVPTEYQWEAAARGRHSFRYPWGNVYETGYCNCEMIFGEPTSPGHFSPAGDSPHGCRDMAGNVREWTRSYAGTRGVDWQNHDPDRAMLSHPVGPASRMVIRGGSYSYDRLCVQNWVRNSQIARRRDMQTGFRLVAEILSS
jgi:formylglycine-generating enzyme required for sulfatase activity